MSSPPGAPTGVKHLNPRQGITTRIVAHTVYRIIARLCVKHLNPRQGITTLRLLWRSITRTVCVKHLNPRQGITTRTVGAFRGRIRVVQCVKHLNPRQGITTGAITARSEQPRIRECETPKSPPGDYNQYVLHLILASGGTHRVKHLNPRQGITTDAFRCRSDQLRQMSVKHLNPRQGITTLRDV